MENEDTWTELEKENPSSSFFPFFEFYLKNALVYLDIDQGIHKVKLKVAWNEKRKKTIKNMANFQKVRLKPLFSEEF